MNTTLNTQPVGYKAKTFEARNLIIFFLLALLLTACGASASTSQPPKPNASSIYIELIIALVLLVGFWLTFRRRPTERIPALQSTLLLYFSLITSNFMGSILHEGGHALSTLLQGGTVTLLYAHPFPFAGYSRPFFDSVLTHMLGYLLDILIPLAIFILIWKRRSVSNLPLLVLFAFGGILNGLTISSGGYDVANLVRLTGLPVGLFTALGILLFIAGFFFMMSVFPLLGLAPENIKSLLVIPAAYFIQCVIGLLVAYLCIPGSPADIRFRLGRELIMTAHMGAVIFPIVGMIFAVIYVTLYRWIYRKLPAGLRTEIVNLTWKDLRTPAVLAAISVILGLIIII